MAHTILRHKKRKVCPVCGEEYTDYSKSGNKKTCSAKCRDRVYRENNPDKTFDRHVYMRILMLKRKGVSLSDSEIEAAKTALQKGRCEICGEKSKRLCIDHEHATGKYRGVICSRCNIFLGYLENSMQVLPSCLDYMKVRNA